MAGRAEISVRIVGDAAQLSRALGQAESGLGRFGQKASEVGRKMTAFASLPIAAAMGAATKAASDLNEAVNVTGLVFGDARGEIDDFTKTAAKQLGQSERAAREATASFGGLLQNLGLNREEAVRYSKQLTVLASDLGSAFNEEPAEAVRAIGSALRGETEPIRRFNVVLDDMTVRQKAVSLGLAGTTAEVTKQGKAQATLALITEQTARVQGDFANTADGLANKSRILKAQLEDTAAKIGTQLLPVALRLADAAQGLVEGFANLDPELQTAIIGFAAVAAAAGPVITIIGNVAKGAQAAAKAVLFLATSNSALAVSSTAVGASLAGLVAGYVLMRQAVGAANRAANEFVENAAPLVNAQLLGADAAKNQAIEAYKAGVAMGFLADSTKDYREQAKQMEPVLARGRELLDNLAKTTSVSKDRIVQLATEMGINLGSASEEAREKLAAAVAQIGRGVGPTERLTNVTETLTNEVATAAETFDAFKEAVDAALGVFLDEQEAALALADRIAELSDTVKENGAQFTHLTEGGRKVAGALIDVVRAAEREVEALVRSGRISADAGAQKAALTQRLEELRRKFPQLSGPIDDYIRHLDTIPTTLTTDVKLNLPEGELERLEQVARLLGGPVFGAPRSSIGARAVGGPVDAGRPYIVGEKGPELFVPRNGGTIVPNGRLTASGPTFAEGAIQISVTGEPDPGTLLRLRLIIEEALRGVAGANRVGNLVA